jgi:osmoprotectant transport system ATP-binding protein
VIQFESVSKTFRDGTTAVDNLSLVVPSGQITVIVGPSGCGKTTTLRMVNRMLEPSKGKITWDDKPIKARRKTTLRRQMGYVIQSGGLFPHRTVLENIATVPDLQRWDKQKSRKRAAELLANVGLDRKLGDRYPGQLSGGQQQRVGVARALAADPLVLLMDEPFSAVDPVVRGELHEFFLGLQRQLSKTIIMITHDIDEAIKLGDQVAILRVGGVLAQVGTPQQLLDEPADAFVEGFVGKDRGYRSLSFQPASGLALGNVQVVRDAGSAGGEGPVLVVDGDARPTAWADPVRPGNVIPLGATFDPETDSLRAALDAALTSPVGLAVAVTGDPRRYAGVVDADMILRQVTQTRAQIAQSIAVRTHDDAEAVHTPPALLGDTQPASDDRQPVEDASTADEPLPYDPDATSVRGVQPVPTVPVVAAAAAAVGSSRLEWSDEEDPDATRIADPLPEDAAGPAGQGTEPSAVPAESAPEPYGAEAPSSQDETVSTASEGETGATAYDAQPAADDGPSEDEWQRAATEEPADEPLVHEPEFDEVAIHEPSSDQPVGHEPVSQEPVSHEPVSHEPVVEESAVGSHDQPPTAEPASADSDDHDREPPR